MVIPIHTKRLKEANLTNAQLSNTELDNANIGGACGTTNDQLEEQAASLSGATMPDGQKYEDWLKSEARGEDGKNTGP